MTRGLKYWCTMKIEMIGIPETANKVTWDLYHWSKANKCLPEKRFPRCNPLWKRQQFYSNNFLCLPSGNVEPEASGTYLEEFFIWLRQVQGRPRPGRVYQSDDTDRSLRLPTWPPPTLPVNLPFSTHQLWNRDALCCKMRLIRMDAKMSCNKSLNSELFHSQKWCVK